MPSTEEAGFLIKLIHDDICELVNRKLKALNVTVSQLYALRYIASQEGRETSIQDVRENLGVSHATAIELIKRLQRKGLVSVSVNQYDRRVRDVCLTNSLPISPDETFGLYKMDLVMMQGFTEKECEQFIGFLRRSSENLNREKEKTQARNASEDDFQISQSS